MQIIGQKIIFVMKRKQLTFEKESPQVRKKHEDPSLPKAPLFLVL